MASISCRLELINRPLDFSHRAHGAKLSAMLYGVNLMPAGAATRLLRPARQYISAPDLSTINAQPSTTPAVCFPSPQFYARLPACTNPETARTRLRRILHHAGPEAIMSPRGTKCNNLQIF